MVSSEEESNSEPKGFQWDSETELMLLKAVCKYKPAGVKKHFNMISILDKLPKGLTGQDVWKHLETFYDIDMLNDTEPVPFPNDKIIPFTLDESEFGDLLKPEFNKYIREFTALENEKKKLINKRPTPSTSDSQRSNTQNDRPSEPTCTVVSIPENTVENKDATSSTSGCEKSNTQKIKTSKSTSSIVSKAMTPPPKTTIKKTNSDKTVVSKELPKPKKEETKTLKQIESSYASTTLVTPDKDFEKKGGETSTSKVSTSSTSDGPKTKTQKNKPKAKNSSMSKSWTSSSKPSNKKGNSGKSVSTSKKEAVKNLKVGESSFASMPSFKQKKEIEKRRDYRYFIASKSQHQKSKAQKKKPSKTTKRLEDDRADVYTFTSSNSQTATSNDSTSISSMETPSSPKIFEDQRSDANRSTASRELPRSLELGGDAWGFNVMKNKRKRGRQINKSMSLPMSSSSSSSAAHKQRRTCNSSASYHHFF